MMTMSTMSASTNARYSRRTLSIDSSSCFFLSHGLLSLDTRAKGDEEVSLSSFYSFLFSSDVVIHVPVVLVSFHVLSIDQTFDSFFQVVIVRRELEFRDDVVDQLRVR